MLRINICLHGSRLHILRLILRFIHNCLLSSQVFPLSEVLPPCQRYPSSGLVSSQDLEGYTGSNSYWQGLLAGQVKDEEPG